MKRLLVIALFMGSLKASENDDSSALYLFPWITAVSYLAPQSTKTCVKLTDNITDNSDSSCDNECMYCVFNCPRNTGCGLCCVAVATSCAVEAAITPVRNVLGAIGKQPQLQQITLQ